MNIGLGIGLGFQLGGGDDPFSLGPQGASLTLSGGAATLIAPLVTEGASLSLTGGAVNFSRELAPAGDALTLSGGDATLGSGALSSLDWYVVVAERDGSNHLVDQTGGGRNLLLPGGSANPVLLDHDGSDYFWFPGTANNALSAPDSAALDITGDLDIQILYERANWAPGGLTRYILTKRGAGQISYEAQLTPSGAMRLVWSADGSTTITETSSANVGLTGGERHWLRWTLDVDNGASDAEVKFYLGGSGDTPSWSQLGTTEMVGATTSIHAGTAGLVIGGRDINSLNDDAKVYRAIIKNGIDGTTVLDVDAADADPDATTFVEASSNAATVTINRSSTGYKTAVVKTDKLVSATDDYMATATDALFQVGAGESATLVWVGTVYGSATSGGLAGISSNGLTVGLAASSQYQGTADDGTDDGTETSAGATRGARRAVAVQVDRASDELRLYIDGTLQASPVDASAIGALDGNTIELGRVLTAYVDAEHEALGFAKSSLTTQQISDIADALITANGGTP